MSRDLPVALADAISAPVVRPFLAVRIDLPDQVLAWTGVGPLTFNDADGVSRDWIGAGGLGAIDAIGEASDGSATGIRASLFAVPSEFRDDIAAQATRGAILEVYAGALNETYQQVEAAVRIWKGRVDDYKITDSGTAIAVEIAGESRAIDQRRPTIKRFSDEYQQRRYPGDRFFEFLPGLTEVGILWAKAEQSPVGSSGSAGGGGASGRTASY